MSGFSGIPADAVAFYAELAEHNTREWWAANKDRYENSVRMPLVELTEALAEEFGPAKVFRPHRDVRFSPDKTPYKDRQGAIAELADGMGFYVQIGPEGLTTGGGYHHHASDQLSRYRAAVDDEVSGGELEQVVDGLRDGGFQIGGDQLKTRPKGVPDGHPRLELLRHKSLVAWRDHGVPSWLSRPTALEKVRADWQAIRPLGEWLTSHVGPTQEPERRFRR
ncbi:MAG: DUF2461 domain-containing protein [Actinomycetota bacterium]|nr:DUF2461 domain-containing protein [Actinomycetota bacterium]